MEERGKRMGRQIEASLGGFYRIGCVKEKD